MASAGILHTDGCALHAALRRFGPAFPVGHTVMVEPMDAPESDVPCGMEFGIRKFAAGESVSETSDAETAWVLLSGAAEVSFEGTSERVSRGSVFDQPPTAVHVSGGTAVTLRAEIQDTEWAVVRTENARRFAPRIFRPEESTPEYRGAGLVQNACLRNVRLIFDRATRPESNLVVGEVVNYPGRWSSYPPHHHDQPEIYHIGLRSRRVMGMRNSARTW